MAAWRNTHIDEKRKIEHACEKAQGKNGSRCLRYQRSGGEAVSGQWDGTMANAWTIWPSQPVGVLSEKDALGQRQLMEVSFKTVYALYLDLIYSFLLIFICLGNMPTIKACQSANKFNKIWPPFTKQVLSTQQEELDPGPQLNASTHKHPMKLKQPARPCPSHFKNRSVSTYDNFSVNRFLHFWIVSTQCISSGVFSDELKCVLYILSYIL